MEQITSMIHENQAAQYAGQFNPVIGFMVSQSTRGDAQAYFEERLSHLPVRRHYSPFWDDSAPARSSDEIAETLFGKDDQAFDPFDQPNGVLYRASE